MMIVLRICRHVLLTVAEMTFAAVIFLLLVGPTERFPFQNLIARAWRWAVAALSQTNLSVVAYSIVSPIAVFLITLALLRKWRPGADASEQLKDSAIAGFVGLAVPLGIMATVFAWNIPQAIYDDHRTAGDKYQELTQKNEGLRADLKSRKHSIFTTDPVFPNTIYLLQAFDIFRHARRGTSCVIEVTAPHGEGAAMASMVAQFSNSVSDCSTFGPDMNFDLNPELEKHAMDGMIPDAIVFHATPDDKAANQLFINLGNQIRLVRSYQLPVKPDYQTPPHEGTLSVIWLQFGTHTMWNSER
jgi:hypothetical protein